MSDSFDLSSAVFAKTELGQQEIQSRSLGLAPLVRRILVLADGKKSGTELAAFLPNADEIQTVLQQLLSLGCLEAQARSKPAASAQSRPAELAQAGGASAPGGDIPGLVPAEKRSAKDNEMARNFMINSINSIIGQQMRISLITDIAGAQTTEQLRTVYRAWEASMSDHGMGKRRLPELKEKLFKVL
jgi:hypothetical protein